MIIPDGSLVLGSPAKIKTTLSEEQQLGLKMNAEHYVANAHRFITDLEEQND
jgi:carbonic anhydrase/acetyltransferase-like protein (isoleucine patch superfamily)